MSQTNQTANTWDMASSAKVHLQQMDDAHWAGNDEAADREFEQAWQLMREAQRIRLNEKVKKVKEGSGTCLHV